MTSPFLRTTKSLKPCFDESSFANVYRPSNLPEASKWSSSDRPVTSSHELAHTVPSAGSGRIPTTGKRLSRPAGTKSETLPSAVILTIFRRIKALPQCQAIFEQRESFAGLSQMPFCCGKKIENRATVRNDGLQFLNNRDLSTDFGGVGRLREHSLDLLFFFLLGRKGKGKGHKHG